jgi:hypothetical protein
LGCQGESHDEIQEDAMLKGMKGVNHIGMGVKNLPAMKQFFGTTLGMTETYLEFPEVWNPMVDVFRTSLHKFAGTMLYPPAGGIVVELIEMSLPTRDQSGKSKDTATLGSTRSPLQYLMSRSFTGITRIESRFFRSPDRQSSRDGVGVNTPSCTVAIRRGICWSLFPTLQRRYGRLSAVHAGLEWL